MKHLFTLFLTVATAFAAGPYLTPHTNIPPAAVSLAWDASLDPLVVGYNVYYGAEGVGLYTNVANVGSLTSTTVSNLVRGAAYHFALTDYYAGGIESQYSTELVYTPPILKVPTNAPPAFKPIVVLSIEYKNSVDDFQYANLFDYPLAPDTEFKALRLQIATAYPLPQMKPSLVALPPLPGQH